MLLVALRGWFAVEGRRNRTSYAIAWALQAAVIVGLLTIRPPMIEYGLAHRWTTGLNLTLLLMIARAICILVVMIGGYLIAAQRFRDMNVTGWAALIYLPLYAIGFLGMTVDRPLVADGAGNMAVVLTLILFAWPGTAGDNRYGPPPRLSF